MSFQMSFHMSFQMIFHMSFQMSFQICIVLNIVNKIKLRETSAEMYEPMSGMDFLLKNPQR